MIEPYPKLVFSSDFRVTQKVIVISDSNIVINLRNNGILSDEEVTDIIFS